MTYTGTVARMPRRLVLALFAAQILHAQPSWWTTGPIRWVQTNLRETDAAMDEVTHDPA